MKSINKKILIALSILIIVIIVGFLFYSTRNINESFITPSGTPSSSELTDTPMKDDYVQSPQEKQTAPSSNNNLLSEKEQSLFNDLLSNKLTDVNIQSLINSGFLTENMIERFLSKLSNTNTNETFVGANVIADMNYIENNKKSLDINNTEINDFVLPNSVFEGFDTNTQIYAKYY